MSLYDDVSSFHNIAHSPTSTVVTSTSSSPTGSEMPVYENIEELTRLCSANSTMTSTTTGKTRQGKPSMSDFLKSIPPPPPIYDDADNYDFCQRQNEPTNTGTSSSVSSSASSRCHIIGGSNCSNGIGRGGGGNSSSGGGGVPKCSSATTGGNGSNSSGSTSSTHRRCFDMRPLSMPHKEMQRIEREQSHRVLIITLLVITIFIVLIAFSIFFFFDVIEQHVNNIAESF